MLASPSHQPIKPQYVEESFDFLKLFPHRYDYLWSPHPAPGDRPDWRTEDRHPLSDRLIIQGAYLYGVRFGSTTNYVMLDIDAGSRYHPSRDPFAIGRIACALEWIGLCSYVAVQSSYSGGIHLYFPWGGGEPLQIDWMAMAEAMDSPDPIVPVCHSEPLPCWAIAQAVDACLSAAGFKSIKGQLEIFPNPKKAGDQTAYNGHRLPLQAGSYLLNSDWEPIFSTRDAFVVQWKHASSRNAPSRQAVDKAIASQPRRWSKLGLTAQKFLNDLNAEIQPGWTSFGQTNNLIGKIALREYVFGHLFTGKKLSGQALQSRVLYIAMNLPGFKNFSKHVLEISKRVSEWVTCVERCPRYYRYGGEKDLKIEQGQDKPLSPNQKRAIETQDAIREAVYTLSQQGKFPESTLDRLEAIRSYLKESRGAGVSPSTLYKYKPLWHPEYLAEQLEPLPRKELQGIDAENDDPRSLESAQEEGLQSPSTISFYATSPDLREGGACTEKAVGGSGGLSTAPEKLAGPEIVLQELRRIAQRKAAQQVDRWRQQPEAPPDEHWFAQMRLSLEVVSDAS